MPGTRLRPDKIHRDFGGRAGRKLSCDDMLKQETPPEERAAFLFQSAPNPYYALRSKLRRGKPRHKTSGQAGLPSSFRMRWKTNAPPKGGASFSVPGTRLRKKHFGGRAGLPSSFEVRYEKHKTTLLGGFGFSSARNRTPRLGPRITRTSLGISHKTLNLNFRLYEGDQKQTPHLAAGRCFCARNRT